MRTLVLILVSSLAGTAEAQVLGYLVAGPASMSESTNSHTTFHAAGGSELIAADRVSLGGELGFFYRFITCSANATLHLGRVSGGRTTPFVTGGYAGLWRIDGETAFRAFNVGAGVHFWLRDHVGLRVELRDHIRPDTRGIRQYWSIRAGVAFR